MFVYLTNIKILYNYQIKDELTDSYILIVFLDVPGQCSEESEWQCLDKKSCIDKRRRCDGYGDCADLSDEDQQLCSNGILCP